MKSTFIFALIASAAVAALASDECVKLAAELQAPNSPCNQFVNQVRQQAGAIVSSTCDKPVTVSTKPTPQCCELAQKFAPCRCDSDVHKTSGKDLAVATYRSTQAGCGGKCVEANQVGC